MRAEQRVNYTEREGPIGRLPCLIGHGRRLGWRAPYYTVMVSVVIAALSGTASIGTAGLMDALNKADLAPAIQAAVGAPVPRVFDVRLAGLDDGAVSCRDGVSLHPSVAAADVAAPDLVVVPGLDDALAASFAANRGWVPWLARWHAAGAKIASSCTGAFLVADAGLLDGRPATEHLLTAWRVLAAVGDLG